MTRFDGGWYLIYTRPRHEKKVTEHLSESGITFYLPSTKRLRTWNDRKKYLDMPLFPSYVFVYLNSMEDYFTGLQSESSLQYVRQGKQTVRVKDSIIQSIRLIVDNEKDIEVSSEFFHAGQQVVIREGPLTGLACEIVQVKGKTKVLVRVELMQRSLLLSLPTDQLKTAC